MLASIASDRGAAGLVGLLRDIRRTDPKSPLLGEEAINQLGYGLARQKETGAAIEVFKLNTELYPSSGNAWDSLAETCLGAGNEELARKYYARALEVQPDYPNAKAARELLETKLAGPAAAAH